MRTSPSFKDKLVIPDLSPTTLWHTFIAASMAFIVNVCLFVCVPHQTEIFENMFKHVQKTTCMSSTSLQENPGPILALPASKNESKNFHWKSQRPDVTLDSFLSPTLPFIFHCSTRSCEFYLLNPRFCRTHQRPSSSPLWPELKPEHPSQPSYRDSGLFHTVPLQNKMINSVTSVKVQQLSPITLMIKIQILCLAH